jgi:hypothetical protein
MAKGYVRIYHEVIARHRSGASADGGRRFAGADG